MVYLQGASIYHRVRRLIRRVKGVLGLCFNISQGKKIIIDALRLYKDSASISHIDLNRCVYGVFAWCFNLSQGKKIIIDAFSVY